jgi:hypothetical protein
LVPGTARAARAWVSVMLPEPIKPMWVVMRRAFYAEFARPAALHESVKFNLECRNSGVLIL